VEVPVQQHWPPDDLPQLPHAADAAVRGHAEVRPAPGDAVDAWKMLEQDGTNEISIRESTVCTVKGIAWRIREEIL
jgi:hypothetical protein